MESPAIMHAILEYEKCPQLNLIYLTDLVGHTDTIATQMGLFQSIYFMICHFKKIFIDE